ncbi:MAG: C-GCAxxG-C-C family protein [Muribaculaceae bacterium]|nr:C-GCAxxG-C-C family protein [Muribaculaceae bacterium]
MENHSLEARINKVKDLRAKGFNCSQCVLMAFDDVHGLDDDTASKLAVGAGGGVGGCGEVCGVAATMAMIEGFRTWDSPKDKPTAYSSIAGINGDFRKKFGALTCRELKQLRRPCNELIYYGVEYMHKHINEPE